MPDVITVIVDDDPIVREALGNLLRRQPGIAVVATLTSGEDAVAHVERAPVDVVLMDLHMPGIGGLAAAVEIKQLRPETRVIILSSLAGEGQRRVAGQLGVDAVVEKTIRAADLVGLVLDASQRSQLEVVTPAAERPEALTERELEVLRLLCEGRSNQEIASALYLSESRVKGHLGAIMRKLGVETRLQAVLVAFRTGLASL